MRISGSACPELLVLPRGRWQCHTGTCQSRVSRLCQTRACSDPIPLSYDCRLGLAGGPGPGPRGHGGRSTRSTGWLPCGSTALFQVRKETTFSVTAFQIVPWHRRELSPPVPFPALDTHCWYFWCQWWTSEWFHFVCLCYEDNAGPT